MLDSTEARTVKCKGLESFLSYDFLSKSFGVYIVTKTEKTLNIYIEIITNLSWKLKVIIENLRRRQF